LEGEREDKSDWYLGFAIALKRWFYFPIPTNSRGKEKGSAFDWIPGRGNIFFSSFRVLV
jgi:hypothetical protein